MQFLHIIRGLPGSGKTTFAQQYLPTLPLYEADMFFETSEGYKWTAGLIQLAHQWCYTSVVKDLYNGESVAVANTFTTLYELERYLSIKLAHFPDLIVVVHEMESQYESIHNVPLQAVQRMESRWQDLPADKNYMVTQHGQ
jgi:adenylate kinase family enzyme